MKPRCLGGGNEPGNLVRLTPEEHYLAHQLLVKIHPTVPGLVTAAVTMTANRPGNKLYGWLRRRVSEQMTLNNPNAGGHSRRAYIARNGSAPRGWTGRVTEAGSKTISDKMREKNPMHGVRPWNHPRATQQSKAIWAAAAAYYEWWKITQLSYHAMARAFGFDFPSMAHHNLVKYFRSGWIPNQDPEWMKLERIMTMTFQQSGEESKRIAAGNLAADQAAANQQADDDFNAAMDIVRKSFESNVVAEISEDNFERHNTSKMLRAPAQIPVMLVHRGQIAPWNVVTKRHPIQTIDDLLDLLHKQNCPKLFQQISTVAAQNYSVKYKEAPGGGFVLMFQYIG